MNSITKDILKTLSSATYYTDIGERFSEKRLLVISTFLQLQTAMDAERLWIYMRKNKQKVSLSCVYQSLNWFYEQGFCQKQKNTNSGLWEFIS